MTRPHSKKCSHSSLQVQVSRQAAQAGFTRPPLSKRLAAMTPSGRATTRNAGTKRGTPDSISEYTFPGPLVLPGDSLAIDPKEPAQTLRSFIQEKARNPLTNRRKTIYICPPPTIPPALSQMRSWSIPSCLSSASQTNKDRALQPPAADDISAYLKAFYHPLPVKFLLGTTSFIPWSDTKSDTGRSHRRDRASSAKDPRQEFVGLQLGNGITRIRTRPCPDGAFSHQINLNDVTDALIEALPPDAHSAVLLVNQDMYDGDDDTFCCGHAFGGSRVAVVSSARYHPALDYDYYGDGHDVSVQVFDRQHMWPSSHCALYVDHMCDTEGEEPPRKKARVGITGPVTTANEENYARETELTALGAAVKAAHVVPDPEEHQEALWLSRMARTVSHEIGHCFTIAHCTYYACVMQGTSGIAEDMRQPPYLCPVCLSKITRAIADVEPRLDQNEFILHRYRALSEFCRTRSQIGMFAGFHAWLEKRVESLVDDGEAT